MIVNWQVTFIWFSIGVSHVQLMRNYNDHHRHQLLTDASVAPPIIGQANYFIPIASNYHDVGGKVISSWSYLFQSVLVAYTDHRDLHVEDLLPAAVAPVANLLVEPFRVQGDVAKADEEAVVAAKAANVADPVRRKRKNILRYRNGEFRPRLCSPRLCLSVRPP